MAALNGCFRPTFELCRFVKSPYNIFLFLTFYTAILPQIAHCTDLWVENYYNHQSHHNVIRQKRDVGFQQYFPKPGFSIDSSYNISENAPVGSFVASLTLTIHDPLPNSESNYTLRIDHASDIFRQFSIDPKEGVVRVDKPLDRESIAKYRLRIEALDLNGTKSDQHIIVRVMDVNDNAPFLNDTHLVIPENELPNFLGSVHAYDPDGPGNGPPFQLEQDPTSKYKALIRTKFNDKCEGCGGFLDVSSLQTVDREGPWGKILMVPILTRDSGSPPQNATRYLKIEIGDKNDNPMFDGVSTIHVYNFRGQLPSTEIGRVFVNDLDDWDVVDKDFKLNEFHKYFTVANNGAITMARETPEGKYRLVVNVNDRVRSEKATGTVNIVVDYLNQDAIDNAGSVRIRGMSAEDFLRPMPNNQFSPYERFRSELASQLNVDSARVKIFSIMPMRNNAHNPLTPYIDVFFAVERPGPGAIKYGNDRATYLSPVFLTGKVEHNRAAFEKSLQRSDQVKIVAVNIDPCLKETCTGGGCTRSLIVPATEPDSLIAANQTSLLGVTVIVDVKCKCPKNSILSRCTPDTCFNGGICHNTADGFFCECRAPFLNGSRCESRTRTFDSGSFAWLKSSISCEKLSLSMEFMTNQPDGMLLYNGPVRSLRDHDEYMGDELALQIKDGFLQLKVSLSQSEPSWLTLSRTRVNDGEWHTVDLIAYRLRYELILDKCNREPLRMPGTRPEWRTAAKMVSDQLSQCRNVTTVAGSNEQLNLNQPLQLGGVAPSDDFSSRNNSLVEKSLIGCIRDLRINGELYDLGDQSVVYAENSDVGCKHTDILCTGAARSKSDDAIADEFKCDRGECVASLTGIKRCFCEPGFTGTACNIETKWKKFGRSSYAHHKIMDANLLSPVYTKLSVLFAPHRMDAGDVVRIQSENMREFMRIGINQAHLQYTFNFGNDVTYELAANLTWNAVYRADLERFGLYSRLSLDGLSNQPYEAQRLGDMDEPLYTMPRGDGDGLLMGAGSVPVAAANDFQGCIRELYYNDLFIPVSESDPNLKSKVQMSQSVSDGCQNLTSCANSAIQCQAPFICVDFWKGPFCTCPDGSLPRLSAKDGTLIGCYLNAERLHVGITRGALAAILISFLALIILTLLLVAHSRQRRKPILSDDNLIGNVCDYREEGGGEADQGRYDIGPLRKPVLPLRDDQHQGRLPRKIPPLINGDSPVRMSNLADKDGAGLASYLRERMQQVDDDLWHDGCCDELHLYAVESDNVSLCSLSSLESDADDQDDDAAAWDRRLDGWGPRFKRLADAYSYDKSDKQD